MYWMRFWGFGQIYFCKTLIIIWYLVVSKTSVIGSLVKAFEYDVLGNMMKILPCINTVGATYMKLELCYLKITICRQMLSFQHLKAQRLIIFYMMAPWKSTCSWLFNYAFKCILLHLKLDLRLFISFVILPSSFFFEENCRRWKKENQVISE